MPITSAQKAAIEEIIDILVSTTPARGKRQLAALFLELVDRTDWPEYYEVLYSIHILPALETRTPSRHLFFIPDHSRATVHQWRESQRGEK